MESVEDINNEEASVEDEPQIHEVPAEEEPVFIQGNKLLNQYISLKI